MDLQKIQTFIAVAEEGNLTRAAERLFLTQPAVSAHLKSLEEELGIRLFQRTAKGMKMTPEGETLLPEARKITESFQQFQKKSLTLSENEPQAAVRLGINFYLESLRIQDLIHVLQAERIPVRLSLFTASSPEILDKVRKNELELGFFFGENPHSDIASLSLGQLNLLVAGSLSWKEKWEKDPEKNLSRYPWILTPEWCPISRAVKHFLAQNRIKPSMVADHEEVISRLVLQNYGFSFLVESEARQKEARQEVFVIPELSFPMEVSLAYSRNTEIESSVAMVIALIQKIWKEECLSL